MQPPVSVQDVSMPNIQRVSPAWLRPVAFGVVLGLHLVLLVGIPWPAGTDIARPPPFEVQVIPQAEPAQLLVPLDSTAVAEVKPANAAPVDVQAVEAQPLSHGQEIAELQPSESALAPDSPSGVMVSSVLQTPELRPLAVPPPTASDQAAQPISQAAGTEASALQVDPPSQGPLPSSGQSVLESEPLEARPPAAAAQAEQPAREAAGAEASALAIDPPNQSLTSEQHVAESESLEVGRPTAPVEVAQPAREAPRTESSIAVSNPPAQGTVSSSEQQVAKLEPYSPATAPLEDEGPITPGRIGQIVRYVEQYDGGRCFFVAPVAVTETEAKLEGYGASARPFEALDTAFRHENGFEASIDVRLVNPAQCPAVTFLGRLRGTNAPHLHIDGANLGPGDALTGTLDGYGGRNVELLLATDAGTVQNVSHLLRPGTAAKSFTIGLRDIGRASGGQPQLLLAVASPLPLDALRFDRPVAADRLFSAVLSEAARTNQPIAAMARYFKLER